MRLSLQKTVSLANVTVLRYGGWKPSKRFFERWYRLRESSPPRLLEKMKKFRMENKVWIRDRAKELGVDFLLDLHSTDEIYEPPFRPPWAIRVYLNCFNFNKEMKKALTDYRSTFKKRFPLFEYEAYNRYFRADTFDCVSVDLFNDLRYVRPRDAYDIVKDLSDYLCTHYQRIKKDGRKRYTT